MVHTAFLVCLVSIVSGCHKNALEQSRFSLDIYEIDLLTACLVENVNSVKKLKLAHLLTEPAFLVCPPAQFTPPKGALVELDFL